MIGTQTAQAQRSAVYQCVPSHHLKIKGKRCLLKHKQICSNERLQSRMANGVLLEHNSIPLTA